MKCGGSIPTDIPFIYFSYVFFDLDYISCDIQSRSDFRISKLPAVLVLNLASCLLIFYIINIIIGSTETTVRQLRKEKHILPNVKQIDTVAGEFPAQNNYLYMTYNASEDDLKITERAFVVLGILPIPFLYLYPNVH